MIEISACIPRGPVFLAGETVECHITFCNPALDPNNPAHSNRDVCETSAWASAQIHCQCTVDEKKVQFSQSTDHVPEEAAITSQETSFAPCKGETGHVAIATKPKILFCDLRLLSGESKTYVYREVLPAEAPPSYRGHTVKYSYKITIGTQRVNSPIKLLRIPIRVLVIPGFMEVSSRVIDYEQRVSPSNPFLVEQEKESSLDMALQMLQTLTARKCPNFYNVTNNKGKVVRFCLFKNSFKLGEDIIGTFDFSQATVPCVQFSATLKSEEIVNDENQIQKQSSSVISYSKCHEYCLHLKRTHMVLPIPLNVTPGFNTNIVSLNWKLHFEFVTTNTTMAAKIPPQMKDEHVTWTGPEALNIETMVWDLPITILPCNPVQVYCGLHMKNSTAMTI